MWAKSELKSRKLQKRWMRWRLGRSWIVYRNPKFTRIVSWAATDRHLRMRGCQRALASRDRQSGIPYLYFGKTLSLVRSAYWWVKHRFHSQSYARGCFMLAWIITAPGQCARRFWAKSKGILNKFWSDFWVPSVSSPTGLRYLSISFGFLDYNLRHINLRLQ